MPSLIRALLLLCCTALAAPLLAQEERYSVILGGERAGELVARRDGQRVDIDYAYRNNGRGPTFSESIVLDAEGLPQAWTIRGNTTFGNKVDERFARTDGTARWTDSTGQGEAAVTAPALYVAQTASPWALGMYARALLADGEGTLPALPAGSVTLASGAPLQVSGEAGTLTVRTHALSGLDLNPSWLLLDASQQLFAVISPRFVVVREGYEQEEQRLRELAADLSTQRLEQIQRETAHRFDGPVRIRNVRVFEPKRLALSAPVDVVFHDDTITGVQPAGSPATPGEVLIDGEGGTLVAGLHEMHAHLSQDRAPLDIAAGITTVRDMGNNNDVLDTLIERIESGTITGPRVVRSGFIEGRSPFNASSGILVDSEAAALDAVRWYAARGFWQVKLYNSMDPAWAPAAVREAHRLGMRVSGHVPAFSNAGAMIDAGFDELTHINQIMLGWVLEPEEDTRTLLRLTALRRLPALDLDAGAVRATIDKLVQHEVAVEPTIAIHEALLLTRNGEVPPGQRDTLSHMPVGVQRDARRAMVDMSDPADAEAYGGAWTQMMAVLRRMRERGVQLIPGTDLGGSFALHRELQLFQQLGYTPAEVLRLATLDMARYLSREAHSGSIERGKLADFFLVPGDPSKDLEALTPMRMVVRGGTVYFPAEIHRAFGIQPFAQPPRVTPPREAGSEDVAAP